MKIKLQAKRLLVDGAECIFDGTVTVDIPPHHERTKLMVKGLEDFKQEDLKEDKDGKKDMERLKSVAGAAARVSEEVYNRVDTCDLKSADGEEIKDKDTLWCHPDATPLVEGLLAKFLTNFAGNKNAN